MIDRIKQILTANNIASRDAQSIVLNMADIIPNKDVFDQINDIIRNSGDSFQCDSIVDKRGEPLFRLTEKPA